MQLGPNIHMALVDGDLIFLDAELDRYSCITRSDAGPVMSALGGSPMLGDMDDVTSELQEAGLLVQGRGSGFRPVAPGLAVGNLHDLASAELPITFATITRLMASAVEAAIKVRSKPARWLNSLGCASDGSTSRAATLALQFERLRPWVPKSGRCLPNSLMLMSFLRRHGVPAQIVVGVRSFPFEAHCWIQHNGVVLNDTVEHVSWYVPIAVA
jgi:hypothetical protein